MIIKKREVYSNGIHYTIRSAIDKDAKELSELRLKISGDIVSGKIY